MFTIIPADPFPCGAPFGPVGPGTNYPFTDEALGFPCFDLWMNLKSFLLTIDFSGTIQGHSVGYSRTLNLSRKGFATPVQGRCWTGSFWEFVSPDLTFKLSVASVRKNFDDIGRIHLYPNFTLDFEVPPPAGVTNQHPPLRITTTGGIPLIFVTDPDTGEVTPASMKLNLNRIGPGAYTTNADLQTGDLSVRLIPLQLYSDLKFLPLSGPAGTIIRLDGGGIGAVTSGFGFNFSTLVSVFLGTTRCPFDVVTNPLQAGTYFPEQHLLITIPPGSKSAPFEFHTSDGDYYYTRDKFLLI